MTRIRVYLVLFAALLLQLGALERIRIFGARPDIVLSVVIFFGLFFGRRAGFETGLVAGIMEGLLSAGPLWINAFTAAATGFLAGALSAKLFRESKVAQLVSVLVFTTFAMSIGFFIRAVLGESSRLSFSDYLLSSAIPTALYTAAVAIPLYLKLADLCGLKTDDEELI
jgi:rod shape-determining protein MreD